MSGASGGGSVAPPRLRGGRPAPWDDAPAVWRALDDAHRHLTRAAAAMDRAAAREGWPVPFSATRFLVLARLHRAGAFGLGPSRLARQIGVKRSTLAHHLDVLEEAGLVERRPRGYPDARRRGVWPTEGGLFALWSLGSALERAAEATPR